MLRGSPEELRNLLTIKAEIRKEVQKGRGLIMVVVVMVLLVIIAVAVRRLSAERKAAK